MKIKFLSSLLLSLCLSTVLFAQEIEIADYSVEYKEREGLGDVIGTDVTLPLISSWAGEGFFVVGLYSKDNLLEILNRSKTSLFLDANFCADDAAIVILGLPEVYFDGNNIFNLKIKGKAIKPNAKLGGDEVYRYDAVLFSEWNKKRLLPSSLSKGKNQKYYLQYDLGKKPRDICLSLKGANYVAEIGSNRVILPKALLKEIAATQGSGL